MRKQKKYKPGCPLKGQGGFRSFALPRQGPVGLHEREDPDGLHSNKRFLKVVPIRDEVELQAPLPSSEATGNTLR
jgi:hypothetical protein